MSKQEKDLILQFHIEPADRGVGIMTEGFSAWVTDGDCWCDADDIVEKKFTWYDNETGNPTKRPVYADYVETCLVAYSDAWYRRMDDEPREKTISLELTQKQAAALGIVFCVCGHPPNNHFDFTFGGKVRPCAHCGNKCPGYKQIIRLPLRP